MKSILSSTARTAVLALVASAVASGTAVLAADQAAAPAQLQVARLSSEGKLQKPGDLANWIFLGASLGMGYNPGSFNAAHPGQFQVAMMEPSAYRYFTEHGSYAPGSMFLLAFYNADVQPRSINQNGFTQADLTNFEIHLVDPKNQDGHSFYLFGAESGEGSPVPPKSACVTCHTNHGAFNGTFAQFYPTIRPLIPKDALERALQDHNIH
jgi:Cytochrome P460